MTHTVLMQDTLPWHTPNVKKLYLKNVDIKLKVLHDCQSKSEITNTDGGMAGGDSNVTEALVDCQACSGPQGSLRLVIVIPILQVGKLKHRAAKALVQGHVNKDKGQSCLNPSSVALNPAPL